jgi:long-subunit fatty acid transport protein
VKPNQYLFASLFVCLLSTSLLAQESDLYGTGGRERGMGVGVASPKGHSSLYYNPAGLTRTSTLNGRLDLSFHSGSASVSSSNPTFNRDAENELGSSAFLGVGIASPVSMDECPTCQKDNAMIAHTCPICGTNLPSASDSAWYDGLYWGVWFEFPVTDGTQVGLTSDQQNPEWAQYGRTTSRLAASLGLAYQVNDWFSAGLSAHLVYISSGEISNSVIAFSIEGEYSNIEINQGVDFSGAVTLGLLFKATENIDVGLTFRSERAGQTNSDSSTLLEIPIINYSATTDFMIRSTPGFSPAQVAAGMEWIINESWSVAFDLTWMNWSAYEGPYSFLITTGQTETATMPVQKPGHKDIIVPRVGAEYIVNETWKVRGGYGYRPNPATAQDGLMNVIDSSAHMFSFGAEYKINKTMSIDAFLQVHLFEKQSTVEDDDKHDQTVPTSSGGTTTIEITPDPMSWSVSGTFYLIGFSFNFVL